MSISYFWFQIETASSIDISDSNSPLLEISVQTPPTSVVTFKSESPFAGDEGSKSAEDFASVNGSDIKAPPLSSLLPPAAFGDSIAAVTEVNGSMEKVKENGALWGSNAFTNGVVKGKHHEVKGEEAAV